MKYIPVTIGAMQTLLSPGEHERYTERVAIIESDEIVGKEYAERQAYSEILWARRVE